MFKESYFKDKNYGEYFIYLISNLSKKIKIEEVGYICGTRQYGESKTASSIFQLFSRGLPYLMAANECRKLKMQILDSDKNLLAILINLDNDSQRTEFFTDKH